MKVTDYNIEVTVPADLEELWEAIIEVCPDCEIRLNLEGPCFYVAPSEEYEHFLTPCLNSVEDLLKWISQNFRKFAKTLETYRETGGYDQI